MQIGNSLIHAGRILAEALPANSRQLKIWDIEGMVKSSVRLITPSEAGGLARHVDLNDIHPDIYEDTPKS